MDKKNNIDGKANIDKKNEDKSIESGSDEIVEKVEEALGDVGKNIKETGERVEEEIESSKRQERQVMWVLFVMVAIIVAVFVIAFGVKEVNKFNYLGLEWEKETFGDIPIYSTTVEGTDEYGRDIEFNFNIRNDPRKLNVPIEGDIEIQKKTVYFSMDFNEETRHCTPSPLVNLGIFMAGMGYKVETTVSKEEYLGTYGDIVVDCSNKPRNTVIMYSNGKENMIKQSEENPNCYIVTFKDCENTKVLETFEIELISKLRGENRIS